MAKRQTRRTVSMSRRNYDRLVEYAAANRVPASALTEYALEQLFAEPLDLEAFRARHARRGAGPVEVDPSPSAEHITDEMRVEWRSRIQQRRAAIEQRKALRGRHRNLSGSSADSASRFHALRSGGAS